MIERTRKPVHPGGIILRECIEPLNLSITAFAEQLGVSRKTLSKIVNERGAVTPDMALRLSRTLGTSPKVWLNLQQGYDLWVAQHETDGWKSAKPKEETGNSELEA
ncbi:HigA family addiction module antitoxin [Pseudodesulfovibrio sp.]|uniref:HigA family addiction module antitoxin n=1 Tax=unclassified Pseudodesulfovibrio TaxID=2661612 RepID=UPI003B00C73E